MKKSTPSVDASVKKAFTFIELIIVIAIIAVLAAAIFVAVDPARRLHEARNVVRGSDTVTILEAVKKYQVDNDGTYYTELLSASGMADGEYHVLGTCTTGAACTAVTSQADCIDISKMGVTYLSEVPEDPLDATTTETKYYIMRGASNEVTVGACETEGEGVVGAGTPPTIEVSR